MKALRDSNQIKYTPATKLRRLGGNHTLVYIFLIMDEHPIKYAKYAVREPTDQDNVYRVFWLGWHDSKNPKDRNFHPLNY